MVPHLAQHSVGQEARELGDILGYMPCFGALSPPGLLKTLLRKQKDLVKSSPWLPPPLDPTLLRPLTPTLPSNMGPIAPSLAGFRPTRPYSIQFLQALLQPCFLFTSPVIFHAPLLSAPVKSQPG